MQRNLSQSIHSLNFIRRYSFIGRIIKNPSGSFNFPVSSVLSKQYGTLSNEQNSLTSEEAWKKGLKYLYMETPQTDQAMKFLLHSSQLGHPQAQFALGLLIQQMEQAETSLEEEFLEAEDQRQRQFQSMESNEQSSDPSFKSSNKLDPSIRLIIKKARKQFHAYRKMKREQKKIQQPEESSFSSFESIQHLPLKDFLNPEKKQIFSFLQLITFNDLYHSILFKDTSLQLPERLSALLFRHAAKESLMDACMELGDLCFEHDPPLTNLAVQWYKTISSDEPRYAEALYNIASILYEGCPLNNIEPNYSEALEYFTQSAELGNTNAQFWLGHLRRVGCEASQIVPDLASSLILLQEAGKNGHTEAQFYLAQFYRQGDETHNMNADSTKFWYWLSKACQAKDPNALYCLGDIYFHGTDGKKQNYQLAKCSYEEAAQQEHVEAMLCLGVIHYQGLGVSIDYSQAFQYYQAAADRHYLPAWKNLAQMYMLGHGVPQNEEMAKSILSMISKMEN